MGNTATTTASGPPTPATSGATSGETTPLLSTSSATVSEKDMENELIAMKIRLYKSALAAQVMLVLVLFMLVAMIFLYWWPTFGTQIGGTVLGVLGVVFVMAALSLLPPLNRSGITNAEWEISNE